MWYSGWECFHETMCLSAIAKHDDVLACCMSSSRPEIEKTGDFTLWRPGVDLEEFWIGACHAFEMFHYCMLKAYDEHLQVLAVHFLLCSMALPWERVYLWEFSEECRSLKKSKYIDSWYAWSSSKVDLSCLLWEGSILYIYGSVAVWNCARSCRPDCQGYSFPTSWWGKCQLASIGHWIRNCCEMCFVHWRKLLDIAVLH